MRSGSCVGVRVHVPAAPHVAPDHDGAEQDQQTGHQQLGRGPEAGRQLYPQHDDQQGEDPDGHRMAESPHQPQAGGAPEPCRGTGRKRGNGRKMVRLKGMAEAQEAPDGQSGYN